MHPKKVVMPNYCKSKTAVGEIVKKVYLDFFCNDVS